MHILMHACPYTRTSLYAYVHTPTHFPLTQTSSIRPEITMVPTFSEQYHSQVDPVRGTWLGICHEEWE